MTQPSTSDNCLPSTDFMAAGDRLTEGSTEPSSVLSDRMSPAIVHPNFDPNQSPIDPARPLTDIPEPTRRLNSQLRRLYGNSVRFY